MTARGDGEEYAQAKAIFAKIRHLVEAAGGSMADIVKVTIFVTDISQREKVWQARRRPEGDADVLQQEQRRRHAQPLELRLAPHRREPRLPLSRQAGRPVVMIQLDETGRTHVVAPCVEVEEAGVTAVAKAFFVVPPRI